jgi:hypothetical protein
MSYPTVAARASTIDASRRVILLSLVTPGPAARRVPDTGGRDLEKLRSE